MLEGSQASGRVWARETYSAIGVMLFLIMAKHQMRTLRWVLVAAVVALVSCGDGSSLTTSEAPPPPTDAGAQVVYRVGDTGPGGGIIVYVNEEGFTNSDEDYDLGLVCLTGTCHYLEMAPFDLENRGWQKAMAAAEAFSTPSANDWLLPSKDALNEMCKFVLGDTVNVICNNNGHGSFLNSDGSFYKSYENLPYWSSYEGGDGTALIQYFHSGIQDYYYKGENSLGVRPVRAF